MQLGVALALFLTFIIVAILLALVGFPWVIGLYEGWTSGSDDHSKLDDWIEGLMDRMYDIGRKQGGG
jgi:hypothetical protein